jgi:dTDP-L-rhamnose 4-epimerase
MKNILITGGLGFIGREVAATLLDHGFEVVLFDNLSSQIHGDIPDLNSLSLLRHAAVRVMRGDVRSRSDWQRALTLADCVIHLAAETGTAQSMYEIYRYTETNVGGTALMLDVLANERHKVKKLILASSRSVYGEGAYQCVQCGTVHPGMRDEQSLLRGAWELTCRACGKMVTAIATPEDAKTAPASIYAATKLAQEEQVRIAGTALGIATVIYRFQNVYGEGQSLKNPYTGILSIFSNQFRAAKTVRLYEDGQESRDFVHVSDVARAVHLGLSSDRANGMTLNVGSGVQTSVHQIAMLLKQCYGAGSDVVVSGEFRVGDIRHGFADLNLIRERLGFAPQVSLEQGLHRFASWVTRQVAEPDRLEQATSELQSRGLMAKHGTA